MYCAMSETASLEDLLETPIRLFRKKKHMNVEHILDGRVIVVRSEFSTCTRSVVSISSCEAPCCPCLKHLRCVLARADADEIRLDEHDWSETNNLHLLLVSVLISDTWSGLRELALC